VLGLLTWLYDTLTRRQRVRVLLHLGAFTDGQGKPASAMLYFIKVTNLSTTRDVEITHIWFATEPHVHFVNPARPLPARLRPEETFETWIDASVLSKTPKTEKPENLCRVRLSRGKTAKSHFNRDVPPFGHIAGGGSH
jgi:hypothetical protein